MYVCIYIYIYICICVCVCVCVYVYLYHIFKGSRREITNQFIRYHICDK